MKRIIANKILLITTLALLIFASFSVVIINYINVKMMSENVTQIYQIYVDSLSRANDMGEVQQSIEAVPGTLRVIVADTSGVGVADSGGDPIELKGFHEENYFKEAIGDTPKVTISRSDVFGVDTIVYAEKFHCFGQLNKEFVLIVSMPITYNNTYFLAMIPLFIAVISVVLFMTSGFTSNLIRSAISPLTLIQKNLEDINRGVYHKVDIRTKYREVERVVAEINTFSSKISNSMDYLSYEQEKLGFILDNMTQGLVALSSKASVVLTNKAALNMFGSSKNLLGCNIRALIDEEGLYEKVDKAIKEKRNAIFEHEIKARIYRIEILIIDSAIQEEHKGIETLITFTDVTQEYNSSRIRSEFFANASHELKTPLTAVKGFSELLPTMTDNEGKNKCAEEITKNTDRMLALIQDMLKLARIDANVNDEETDYIELRKLVDEVVDHVASIAKARKITINVDGDGTIYGRPKQIEEVVTNLIDNAIKYNVDGGKVDVTISENDSTTSLIVEDTGIGIDIKHQSRIFERFYRVDKGRNRKVSSTGLGLAIVKHIVLQHSGTIAFDSMIGRGTKFKVTFPCSKSVVKSNQ